MGGNVDPCLYVKKSEKVMVYVALHIYDHLMREDVEAIDDALTALKEKELVLKVMKGLQDYLSCEVKFSTDKKRV